MYRNFQIEIDTKKQHAYVIWFNRNFLPNFVNIASCKLESPLSGMFRMRNWLEMYAAEQQCNKRYLNRMQAGLVWGKTLTI